MQQLIQVNALSRDYKVAKRDGGFLNFMFSRKFEIIHAVNAINFNITKGELVGFVGPNGAGKWTFAVDKTITTTGHLVFEISKIAEIADMEIKEQAVEDIIHDIYKNGI